MLFASTLTIVMILLYALFYYFFLPPLSLAYIDGALFFSIGILMLIVIFFIWKNYKTDENSIENNITITFLWLALSTFMLVITEGLKFTGTSLLSLVLYIMFLAFISFIVYKIILDIKFELDNKPASIFVQNGSEFIFCSFLVLLGIMVLVLIASTTIFHWKTMYNQLGTPEEKSFKEDLVEIDNSQIPTVDIDLADILGDKKLGDELALGSQTYVAEFNNKQAVNGKLMYVAPLEHSGFFKWLNNISGTTGYIKISATNSNDVELVRDVNLKYIPSAYFGDDLVRHIRFNGYLSQGLTEFSFELDDSNKPYWVATTYSNLTFWTNPEATGVVICNPQTGDCNWYSIEDTPSWVDIIQPEEFIITQIQNYGEYVHGVFNFSDKDKLTMTEHMTTVYNDGECYYYTGLSSSGIDNSTVGFILVNTRDKSSKFYRMVGATEAAAMSSAEGKVQNMHYISTTPIPLNISGVPSYFSTLKDEEGLVKAYAMVNIEDYSIVGTGNSIMEAKRAYINSVNSSGQTVNFAGENSGTSQKTGIVNRISSNIENGNTYYYMVIDNDMTKLYVASYSVSEELPVTREGDNVTVTFTDSSGDSINLVSFDNLNIR